jgi:C4-dicarboxylate transporter DctM subunit
MSTGLHHDAILADESIKTVRSVGIGAALSVLTEGLFKLSALALLAAGIVLTYGVITAHATGTSIVWQDEVTIFLVAGAMFLAAASVQGKRGHIGIELMSDFLSPRANAARHMIVDVLSFAFCAVFAWKTGALLTESIRCGSPI